MWFRLPEDKIKEFLSCKVRTETYFYDSWIVFVQGLKFLRISVSANSDPSCLYSQPSSSSTLQKCVKTLYSQILISIYFWKIVQRTFHRTSLKAAFHIHSWCALLGTSTKLIRTLKHIVPHQPCSITLPLNLDEIFVANTRTRCFGVFH